MNQYQHRIEKLSVEKRRVLSQWISRQTSTQPHKTIGRQRLCAFVTLHGNVENIDAASLRDYLSTRLPNHMVPDSISIIDSIPQLPNGKVNVHGLPDPQSVSNDEVETTTAPRNATEKILADIWSDLLGLDVLSVHDNFFEVGGDSITSIQIVSRAREAGLQMEPRQLTDNPTVASLAAIISADTPKKHRLEQRTGTATLSPVQSWFLNRDLVAPQHWNQSVLLQTDQQMTVEILTTAINICVNHHEALRAQFRNLNGKWTQTIPDDATSIAPDVAECDSFAQSDFERFAASWMGEFDLANGPLIRFSCFRLRNTGDWRLLIVAHHLVIDHVSWSILLEDLERLCLQLINGEAPSLPQKTTSFIEWTKQLQSWAATEECRNSADYWTEKQRDKLYEVPRDILNDDIPDEASAQTVIWTLSEAITRSLLTKVNQAYNTQTNDILLTALAMTLTAWTTKPGVRIDLEGHGRESLFDDVDPGRTVGWLTSFFPIYLPACDGNDYASAIKTVKERLRSLPNRGLNYGVLKYLCDESSIVDALCSISQSDVLFNYLGTNNPSISAGLFEPLQLNASPSRAGNNARSHVLEINVSIVGDRLTTNWIFSRKIHHQKTIQHLAGQFEHWIENLITHCTAPAAGGFTASDFPESGLNQEELELFLDELD